MGLRELKKEQTRQLIADTAWRLFADRGFDQVTVAEIAREAQVAEATVFNYFRTKEDLFYSRFEAFSARLADAVRDREPGDVDVGRQEGLQGDRGGELAGADQAAGVVINLLVDRLEEMRRLEEIRDPVERLVVDQDGAQQGLLRLDIVRSHAIDGCRFGRLLARGRIER